MFTKKINILLAEDDEADCLLFKDALKDLPVSSHLTIVRNGEELMQELAKKAKKLPHVLFLDINMPRKNGYASLGEIKRSTELQHLPVVIFSTASGEETVNNVYNNAAHYYICKPTDFLQLKKVIYEALTLVMQKDNPLPKMERFMITGDSILIPESNENKSKG